jgi:single-stranded-DNA-specific exonuclease
MKWNKKTDKIPKSYEALEEILLKNRDLTTKNSKLFFNPTSPIELDLKQVDITKKTISTAIKIITQAIQDKKKIVIFGDYDADGICASAILWESLYAIYSDVNPDSKKFPVPFIPHREKHGYGISITAVDEIIEKYSPELIITVDNGIVAHEAAEYVQDKGIQLVITDHHQPEYKNEKEIIFPKSDCVLHSTKLYGASVAWMLVRELENTYLKKNDKYDTTFQSSLDLAGIATIADQVPLFEANRSFAQYGLDALRNTKRIGLQKLFTYSKIKQADITEWSVGFAISPRINAMGRLEHGLDALRLLCTKKPSQAEKFAQLLNETNQRRQDLTKGMVDDAKVQVKEKLEENIIIVYSSEYHEGILGLIAGGLTETYGKPSIAISLAGEFAKASARSVSGVNIVEILRQIKDDLLAVGGHPMAAGFSFDTDKLELVTKKLYAIAKKEINSDNLEKSLSIDCEVAHSLLTLKTTEELQKYGPFGMGNPQPQFQVNKLEVLEVRTIGKDHSHVKFKLGSDSIDQIDVIGWRMAKRTQDIQVGDLVNIVGGLGINEWNNRKLVQFTIKDIQNT